MVVLVPYRKLQNRSSKINGTEPLKEVCSWASASPIKVFTGTPIALLKLRRFNPISNIKGEDSE